MMNANRKPLAGNGNAQMATGMPTRIAPQTCGEWFFVLPLQRGTFYTCK